MVDALEIMYTHTKIFNDHIKFYRHFCFCFSKAFNKGNGVYTSLIIAILMLDIYFVMHWDLNFIIFQQSYTSDFAMLVHTHLRYTDILVGGVWYIILRIMLFLLLLRFVNLTRLDLKENVLFFFFIKLRYNYWMFTTLN